MFTTFQGHNPIALCGPNSARQPPRAPPGTPELTVIEGGTGLVAAQCKVWSALPIERCAVHKLFDLTAKASARPRRQVAKDYWGVSCTGTALVLQQQGAFAEKWRLQRWAVVPSFDGAGDELFIVLRFPRFEWKGLRTTNALEQINQQFRCQTTIQASLPSRDAVLLLLFGLLRAGQVTLRRIERWQEAPQAAAFAVVARTA